MKHNPPGVTVAACVCYAATAASLLAGMIRYKGWGSTPLIAAVLLLIIALLCRSTLLLGAGALIRTVISLYALVEDQGIYAGFLPNLVMLLRVCAAFAASALLLAMALSKRRAVCFGYMSGGCALLSLLLYFHGWLLPAAQRTSPQSVDAVGVALHLAAILGSIFAGYARREMPPFRAAWRRLFAGEKE